MSPRRVPRPQPGGSGIIGPDEALSPGDEITYHLTMEVSPAPGQKAWIKVGTSASVRDGENTEDAVRRVAGFVESELDRRIDELGT